MHVENNYLVLDEQDIIKNKKIAGHSFVGLIGYDRLKPIGDTLLSMFGFVKEEVDPKWLKRGDFAESIVKYIYNRDGHNCTTYDKKEIKYDNFSNYQNCGGLIDIELLDENTLIEVKSKSMKDYSFISNCQPKQEVYQGLYYGYLRGYNQITMEWIFFDSETEQAVFEGRKPESLKNLKRISKTFDVNRDEIEMLIKQALYNVNNFVKTRKIELKLVSDKCLKQLNLDRYGNFTDLPF